ncbi:MAG: transcription antitermination factor NusB, partial [bacterium]
NIINLVFEKKDLIDERIREKIQKWEFHRLAVVDRCILRISAAELFFVPDVPPKVVINEAIELAKKFSTEQSGRFINGILDAIYEDIRKGRWVINEGVVTPR